MGDSSKDPWKFPRGIRAVVTDGSSAIGAAVIEELSRKGVKILTCGRNEQEMQEMVKSWKQKGLKVEGVKVDLTTVAGRQSFGDVLRIWLRGKSLDVLVNSLKPDSFDCEKDSKEKNENEMADEFHSMSMLTTICLEHLKRYPGTGTTGSVINIVMESFSNEEMKTNSKLASKAATEWSLLWGRDGIRVNTVVPGLINTISNGDAIATKKFQESASNFSPTGEMGKPRDVAGLVTFLCMPMANFITGQVIHVDGGFSCTAPDDAEANKEKQESTREDAPLQGHSSKVSYEDDTLLEEDPSSGAAVFDEEESAGSNTNQNEVTLATPSLEDFCRELEEGESVKDDSMTLPIRSSSGDSLEIKARLSSDARWEEWKNKRDLRSSKELDRFSQTDSIQHDEQVTSDRAKLRSSLKVSSFSAEDNRSGEKEGRDDIDQNRHETHRKVTLSRRDPILYENIQSVSFQERISCNKIQSVSFQESTPVAETSTTNRTKACSSHTPSQDQEAGSRANDSIVVNSDKSKSVIDVNRLKGVRDRVRRLQEKRKALGLPPHPPQRRAIEKSKSRLRCVFPNTKVGAHADTGQEDDDFILYDGFTTYEV